MKMTMIAAGSCAACCAAAVLQPQNRIESIRAERLMPLEERAWTVRYTEGENRGQRATASLSRASSELGDWAMELGDSRTTYISRGGNDGLWITAEDLKNEGYRLIFDPPVRLIPAVVEAGTSIESVSRVTVYDLEGGDEIGSGRVTHTLRPLGKRRIETPAGSFETVVLRLTQSADLDLADYETEVESAYAPGRGRVWQRIVTNVEKLGLFGDTTTQTTEVVSFERP